MRKLCSGLLLAQSKKVTSECFAALSASIAVGGRATCPRHFCMEMGNMDNIKLYEVVSRYIDYLAPHAQHLFHNKQAGQQNERKYIGIILTVNGMDYFAPLSSFKEKHRRMQESLDFIKVKNYAVINLNNMFPVPVGQYFYVDISKVRDLKYRSLLQAEYRYIKSIQQRIRKNAATLYRLKVNGPVSPLTKRCNDFAALEKLCKQYR